MKTSDFEPQVVIIGSGPAGVSAAFPLVEKGVRVLMLNAGRETHSVSQLDEHDTLRQLREGPKYWKLMIGEQYERFDAVDGMSPRYRIPSYRRAFAEFKQRYAISTDNFNIHGSLESGGLSNMWGTGVCRFDDEDLADYPISFQDLRRSYQRVVQRIGVSGTNDDDLSSFYGYEESLQPPLVPRGNAQLLYRRYRARSGPAHKCGVFLGHIRAATLTRDLQDRRGCVNCGLCVYGCVHRSMWSAKYDLEKLSRFPNFIYLEGAFVSQLRRLDSSYMIGFGPDQHRVIEEVETKQVVLASGTIGSAKLVMDALRIYDKDRTLLSNTMAGFALFVPRWWINGLVDEEVLGSAQLTYRVITPDSKEGYASGYIFIADTIPTTELLTYIPFVYPLSRRIIRRLQPALMIGTCYLGGNYGRHKIRLDPCGSIKISSGLASTAELTTKTALDRLASALMRYGVYQIPGSVNLSKVGDDVHYAGTVPMRASPRIGEANSQGEVQGLPGVYVVDGSALTALPPKVHTLTIMANADRIATAIAAAQPN